MTYLGSDSFSVVCWSCCTRNLSDCVKCKMQAQSGWARTHWSLSTESHRICIRISSLSSQPQNNLKLNCLLFHNKNQSKASSVRLYLLSVASLYHDDGKVLFLHRIRIILRLAIRICFHNQSFPCGENFHRKCPSEFSPAHVRFWLWPHHRWMWSRWSWCCSPCKASYIT